jgi:hypothetical protein
LTSHQFYFLQHRWDSWACLAVGYGDRRFIIFWCILEVSGTGPLFMDTGMAFWEVQGGPAKQLFWEVASSE